MDTSLPSNRTVLDSLRQSFRLSAAELYGLADRLIPVITPRKVVKVKRKSA